MFPRPGLLEGLSPEVDGLPDLVVHLGVAELVLLRVLGHESLHEGPLGLLHVKRHERSQLGVEVFLLAGPLKGLGPSLLLLLPLPLLLLLWGLLGDLLPGNSRGDLLGHCALLQV